ncbi:MAG: 50S ribosomal protein L6 [Candidatus Saccharimonadales bacterium]|nr:50S ribosomal protein L6 [Candidatus Saccharimonadales bacterium]
MTRVGKQPIKIPDGITVETTEGIVAVKGTKGSMEQAILSLLNVAVKEGQVFVERQNDEKVARSNQGLMRSLISNMIEGVSQGFKKQLEVEGVGFKVNLAGKNLKLSLGFSHEINYAIPEDIEASVDGNTITIEGVNKQRVGQIAAEIRALRKPEPYKGKGIHYVGEQILRKAGKAAVGTGE